MFIKKKWYIMAFRSLDFYFSNLNLNKNWFSLKRLSCISQNFFKSPTFTLFFNFLPITQANGGYGLVVVAFLGLLRFYQQDMIFQHNQRLNNQESCIVQIQKDIETKTQEIENINFLLEGMPGTSVTDVLGDILSRGVLSGSLILVGSLLGVGWFTPTVLLGVYHVYKKQYWTEPDFNWENKLKVVLQERTELLHILNTLKAEKLQMMSENVYTVNAFVASTTNLLVSPVFKSCLFILWVTLVLIVGLHILRKPSWYNEDAVGRYIDSNLLLFMLLFVWISLGFFMYYGLDILILNLHFYIVLGSPIRETITAVVIAAPYSIYGTLSVVLVLDVIFPSFLKKSVK